MRGWLLLLFVFTTPCVQADITAWKPVVITGLATRVMDGDTFDVDLNQNGRFEKPSERVRLLYVDTPELHDSYKGKDRRRGLAAKDFLKKALSRQSLVLWVDPGNSRGNYGRLLGVLMSEGVSINVALIAAGHSYYDTRFSQAPSQTPYIDAECQAWQQRLGIWSSQASRKHYQRRLRREGKKWRCQTKG